MHTQNMLIKWFSDEKSSEQAPYSTWGVSTDNIEAKYSIINILVDALLCIYYIYPS